MNPNTFNDFKGKAKPLDDIDLPKLGRLVGVGEDEIHAFLDVETKGHGFDAQGRPRILFERHIFYRQVSASKRAAAVKAELANARPGGYGKESAQYGRLKRAMEIDPVAALMSCSWGLGQVMGFNHQLAGFDSVEAMVRAMMDDEEAQLLAAINFIKNTGLGDELRRHDWAGFAKGYNGPAYKRNAYDRKLANAYAKWSRIKDTPYRAEVPEKVKKVVKDVAARDRRSSTAVLTAIGGASGTVAATKEAVDTATETLSATKSLSDALIAAGPWLIAVMVIAGAAYWIWRERRRHKNNARDAEREIDRLGAV